ncbi:hypothetical protein DI392_07445 [Vibrio albus]|uniref:Superfamily II DNA and RNA helicase n=1 Tax=Vibrio albus TaxID=2200953 RepID=A0A2U3BB55_9VIBR|nr:hypothetical protein [Vibrio albus]PWI34026.1 hypothetical protein DI392_07445 [Vibrio albus]
MLQITPTKYTSSSVSLMSTRLALLSQKEQWVFFTSECPRPSYEVLSRHQINCNKIVQIKPSSNLCEEEIVIKAIKAGTASAVVASDNFSEHSKNTIMLTAEQYQCEVFFISREMTSCTYH